MEIGFESIGNATLICYDKKPVLVTDPWLTGGAYFESWTLSHEIPEEQMKAILSSEYVWLSHGHPDHLSSASLKLLKGKRILLPDHVGSRIYGEMETQGYDVHRLKDRQWIKLSDRIRILTIADYYQDAIILIDINGRLIVNTNDAGELGWGPFVRKTIKKYDISFLLSLSGFGDADMLNYFDERGERIMPIGAKRIPFGKTVALFAEGFGVKYFLPFSSMHQYRRSDSLWANRCVTALSDYEVGFESKSCKILPAFIRYDCLKDQYQCLNPAMNPIKVLPPEEIGDSWDDPLEPGDFELVKNYFKAVSHLERTLDFINVRVAGKDHRIEFNRHRFDRGITFETPRKSLMLAVTHQIFDDLLIGNFMKTTLHGTWRTKSIYPYFSPYVPKYADNGRARTREELAAYFKEYRKRAFLDYFRHKIEEGSTNILRPLFSRDSKAFHVGRIVYYKYKRLTSAL